MNKERELLKRALFHTISCQLREDIQELLAQPEQALTGDTILAIWRDGYDAMARLTQSETKRETLRDHLAGLAMQALMSVYINTGNETPSKDYIAHWAYEQADAMSKERKVDDE